MRYLKMIPCDPASQLEPNDLHYGLEGFLGSHGIILEMFGRSQAELPSTSSKQDPAECPGAKQFTQHLQDGAPQLYVGL